MNLSDNYSKLKKWELIKSEDVYKTNYFSVEKRAYKLPNGKIVDDYYHTNRSDYVLVIAVNSKNEILLEKTYRRGVDDFVIELPAGWLNIGETSLQAGIRELAEETGYTGNGEVLGEIYVQPGYMDQKAHVIKILIDEANKINPKLDDDEELETSFVSFSEINNLIRSGNIKDMGMLSALALFDRVEA
jgi:ADP-ribose pyrophosphatase